jgi:hypothetical protein
MIEMILEQTPFIISADILVTSMSWPADKLWGEEESDKKNIQVSESD